MFSVLLCSVLLRESGSGLVWLTHRFHFLEGVDQAAFPGLKRVFGYGFNVRDYAPDGFRHEGTEDKLPQFGMVISLVEKDGLFPQHPLFACWEGWLEQMGSSYKHKFCSFWA